MFLLVSCYFLLHDRKNERGIKIYIYISKVVDDDDDDDDNINTTTTTTTNITAHKTTQIIRKQLSLCYAVEQE